MKKIFAIIMSVLMIACFMPTMAFAEDSVASVGDTTYETLDAAFVALNENNHKLTLTNDGAWANKNVYWKAGEENGYADTLREAMETAYGKNSGAITIICKPNATITGNGAHINVENDITIYANGANFGGTDVSIGTYKEPTKNETAVVIYDAKNLTVWGQPTNRGKTWNVSFTDCTGEGYGFVMYRNNEGSKDKICATLRGCKATGYGDSIIHTTADGSITIENCEFSNNCAPVNIAHKQDGVMKVAIDGSTFTACGKADTSNNYFAPARFVNNSSTGTLTATIDNCTFTDTVECNGDILIGDGRTGKSSNDVTLTISNTTAEVQAQRPGYYGDEGVKNETYLMKTRVEKSADSMTLTNAAVGAVAEIENDETTNYYDTLANAVNAATEGQTITLLNDVSESISILAGKTVTINIAGHTLSKGVSGTVTVEDDGKLIIKDSVGNGKVSFDPSEYLESSRYYASKTTNDEESYWTIKRYTYSGSSSSSSTTTTTDSVTNTTEDKKTDASTETGGATETNKVATTTATVKTETKTAADGTKTVAATVDTTTASKIVEKAVENKSEEVVVNTASAATVTETAAGTKTEVALPEQTVKAIAKETEAAVTIKSDAAEVKLDTEAVKAVADQAGDLGTVNLVVETVAQNESKVEVDLKLVTSKGTVSDFKGGSVSVTVKLNTALAAKPVVCVYIDDHGTYHKVKGEKNADGTFTFETGHFSTYAVMAEDEADGVIAEQTKNVKEKVNDLSLKARSAKTEKGSIKVTLTVNEDAIKAIEDLGYTVKYKFYRSTKKSASYKAALEKADKTYTNTTGKKGTRYYYKARVMVYDAQGELIAKTALNQCKYAARTK